ncbi:MAG TPA: hypothetical protein VG944_11225, partial [Fimbriimonas sp.]|nr:hypothetical protein [Fimbriimonas sp.]
MEERLNSEGIRRDDLMVALRDRRQVMGARRIDSCMLCRRHNVNNSGLCEICYGALNGDEQRMAERWLNG